MTCSGAVVVAQLVEQSHLTQEVRGSNPVIGFFPNRTYICLLSTEGIEKTKLRKEAVNGPFNKEF